MKSRINFLHKPVNTIVDNQKMLKGDNLLINLISIFEKEGRIQ